MITGHSTNIKFLHSAQFVESSDDTTEARYIISVAHGDRVVSVWSPPIPGTKSSKRCKRAKASFILQDEPVWSSVTHNQVSPTSSIYRMY